MAEDTLIKLVEDTHAFVQEQRAAKGLPPYPFHEVRPISELTHGVLTSLRTVEMELVLCKCGCGYHLSEGEANLGRTYKHGHKPKKLREAPAEKVVVTAPAVEKISYPRMLRFAEVELENLLRTSQQMERDVEDKINKIGAMGTRMEQLRVLIQNLKPLAGVKDENNLPSRPDGGVQRHTGPQLAQPGNSPVALPLSDLEPYDAGLSGQGSVI